MESSSGVARIVHANPFKVALGGRKRLFGCWSSSTSNLLAEIVGEAGFDWMLIDSEHAPNDMQRLIGQLQAIRGSDTQAVGRPLQNDASYIKQFLDIGFRNLLIPYIETVEDARLAVSATRYPPAGVRGVSSYHRNNGYGRDKKYFEYIDQSIGVVAQIESKAGLENLEAIGQVSGIDALFVGPGDLAASLGHLGHVAHSDVQYALREIGRRAGKADLSIGIAAGNTDDVEKYISWGYRFFTVGSDMSLFREALTVTLDALEHLRHA